MIYHDPLPEDPLGEVQSGKGDVDNAPLVFVFDTSLPHGESRHGFSSAPAETVGFVDTTCWMAVPALRPESRALALAAAAAETVNFASSTQLLLGSNPTDLEPPEAVSRAARWQCLWRLESALRYGARHGRCGRALLAVLWFAGVGRRGTRGRSAGASALEALAGRPRAWRDAPHRPSDVLAPRPAVEPNAIRGSGSGRRDRVDLYCCAQSSVASDFPFRETSRKQRSVSIDFFL